MTHDGRLHRRLGVRAERGRHQAGARAKLLLRAGGQGQSAAGQVSLRSVTPSRGPVGQLLPIKGEQLSHTQIELRNLPSRLQNFSVHIASAPSLSGTPPSDTPPSLSPPPSLTLHPPSALCFSALVAPSHPSFCSCHIACSVITHYKHSRAAPVVFATKCLLPGSRYPMHYPCAMRSLVRKPSAAMPPATLSLLSCFVMSFPPSLALSDSPSLALCIIGGSHWASNQDNALHGPLTKQAAYNIDKDALVALAGTPSLSDTPSLPL